MLQKPAGGSSTKSTRPSTPQNQVNGSVFGPVSKLSLTGKTTIAPVISLVEDDDVSTQQPRLRSIVKNTATEIRSLPNVTGVPKARKSPEKTISPLKRKAPDAEIDLRTYKKDRLMTSFGEIVTLIVGGNESHIGTKLFAYKDMLCAASPFFEAACKPEWQDTEQCLITLPEDDPAVLKVLLNWIYQNEIRLPSSRFSARNPLDEICGFIVQLYVLGDKYQMPRLRNDAMDALYSNRIHGLAWEVINYGFKNTLDGSPLRAWLVKEAVAAWSADTLESLKSVLCPEFICSIAIVLMREKPKSTSEFSTTVINMADFCKLFHHHESTMERKCDLRKPLEFL